MLQNNKRAALGEKGMAPGKYLRAQRKIAIAGENATAWGKSSPGEIIPISVKMRFLLGLVFFGGPDVFLGA